MFKGVYHGKQAHPGVCVHVCPIHTCWYVCMCQLIDLVLCSTNVADLDAVVQRAFDTGVTKVVTSISYTCMFTSMHLALCYGMYMCGHADCNNWWKSQGL